MPEGLKLTDVVSRAKDHLATEVDSQFILMSIEQGVYCGLDDIGSDIWRRLDAPMSIARLCDVVAADYRGDRERITNDIVNLLTSLRDQRLIDVG
ncbi:PqqD family protein [Bradyrhizobium sp. HKCCYLS20291]|uniref:PqqD family protein n=1 Tax=Bradyrhizobium sp. HKCCYLS20291 TaxID=3420766 RepID=UPI003EBC2389